MRWLRPEFSITGRFDVSEFLALTVRSVTSISPLDLADTTLPWWDQFQTGLVLELNLAPPLRQVFRQPDDNRELTLPETES
jgi:hypothetical protein